MNETQKWVNHTVEVQLSLEKCMSALKDAETSQRGFLLTHDSTFLTPYNGAHTNSEILVNEIGKLTIDNPEQQKNVIDLKKLVDKRFDLMNSTLQNGQFFSDQQFKKTERILHGKLEMDTLRMCITRMLNTEQILLEKREEHRDKYLKLTLYYALGLLLFSLAITTFCYLWLKRELKKKYINN
ncbi:MAG: CHASE3 domain-containing protein [Taibaiella sp.]|nr:CHASE3 domain-containing protein [Taibaiella sp.]